ncbi:Uncharacterized protein APZ42_007316, partial [Daphnia magna]
EVIEKFTIDSKASEIVRRDEKRKLGEEWMHGTFKFCKYNSKVQYKNTSNWVRHLLQHPVEHQKYKILMSESNSKEKKGQDPPIPHFFQNLAPRIRV